MAEKKKPTVSIGDYVKIERAGEAFWVWLTSIGSKCEGIIDNVLVDIGPILGHKGHGLQYGDLIKFKADDILNHQKG